MFGSIEWEVICCFFTMKSTIGSRFVGLMGEVMRRIDIGGSRDLRFGDDLAWSQGS
jgi:hypothetical protein